MITNDELQEFLDDYLRKAIEEGLQEYEPLDTLFYDILSKEEFMMRVHEHFKLKSIRKIAKAKEEQYEKDRYIIEKIIYNRKKRYRRR